MTSPATPGPRGRELRGLALLFLRLGAIGFGGPAAHLALFEDEVVRRRGWLTREEFLDLLGAVNLIPGPNSTEFAMHVGLRRAGGAGLVVAGLCFLLPAAGIVAALAWAYVEWGALPRAEGMLRGVKPVVIAVVLQALWGLGRTALRTPPLAVLAAAAAAANLLGVHELLVLLAGGAAALLLRGAGAGGGRGTAACAGLLLAPGAAGAAAAAAPGLWPLSLFFLKVGSVMYGSGYVLLAYLRADLVERWGWLTERQLLDATAVGQVTPGPLLTTATFVGWVLEGPAGAALATAAIFLPAFVLVALSAPLLPRLRASPAAGAFLDGLAVASLALMGVVSFHLGRAALADLPSVAIAAAALVLLVRFRANAAWLVAGGALAGSLLPWS
jgi:chromate transporter